MGGSRVGFGGSPKHSSFRIFQQDRLLREAARRAEQSFGILAKVDSVIGDIRATRDPRFPIQRFNRFNDSRIPKLSA